MPPTEGREGLARRSEYHVHRESSRLSEYLTAQTVRHAGLRKRTARVAEVRCEAAVLRDAQREADFTFLPERWPARRHGPEC